MSNQVRTCRICQIEKPINEFKKDDRYTDGHIWQCKTCRNKQNAESRKRTGKKYSYPENQKRLYDLNAEQRRAYTREWCKNNKDRKIAADKEYRQKNLQKLIEKGRKWYSENIERVKEYRVSHREQRKAAQWNRRARQLSAPGNGVTAQQWEQVKADYCYRCGYCGEKKPLTQDHIVPLSSGGAHDVENSIPACQSCNSSKGSKSLLFYLFFRTQTEARTHTGGL